MKNQILEDQCRPEHVRLVWAACIYYSKAKSLQTLFIFLALILPVVGTWFGADNPWLKPYLALCSSLLLVVEIFFASTAQKKWTKTAAKIQEQFDTQVFQLPWNQFVVGSKVEPESVRGVTKGELKKRTQERYETWYHASVAEVPLPLGRLVSQRTNIFYDMRVREKYRSGLVIFLIVLGFGLGAWGVHEGLNWSGLLTTVLVPFTPLAAIVAREFRRQADAIDALTSLRSEVEKLWTKAMQEPTAPFLQDSRNLQDAIYRNRTSNPLVWDWVYEWYRNGNEDDTKHGAADYVEQAKRALAEAEKKVVEKDEEPK